MYTTASSPHMPHCQCPLPLLSRCTSWVVCQHPCQGQKYGSHRSVDQSQTCPCRQRWLHTGLCHVDLCQFLLLWQWSQSHQRCHWGTAREVRCQVVYIKHVRMYKRDIFAQTYPNPSFFLTYTQKAVPDVNCIILQGFINEATTCNCDACHALCSVTIAQSLGQRVLGWDN